MCVINFHLVQTLTLLYDLLLLLLLLLLLFRCDIAEKVEDEITLAMDSG